MKNSANSLTIISTFFSIIFTKTTSNLFFFAGHSFLRNAEEKGETVGENVIHLKIVKASWRFYRCILQKNNFNKQSATDWIKIDKDFFALYIIAYHSKNNYQCLVGSPIPQLHKDKTIY